MRDRRINILIALLFLVVIAVFTFREVFDPGRVLFMTDNNLGGTANFARFLPEGMYRTLWDNCPLLGFSVTIPFSFGGLLLWVMPLIFYMNWYHAIMMGVASLGFILFCVQRRCGLLSSLIGSLAAFWIGSSMTLVYSGHNGKYGVLAFAGIALWLIEKAANHKCLVWNLLAGSSIGLMFVEQQDVGLFIALFLGAYAVYALLRENSWRWRALVLPLLTMGTMVLLVGGPNILSGYMTQVKGVVSMGDENPQQKWDYCTSWSLPPEDVLEFIAPGFRGVRTGEPEGPYWGRMGRSPGWEQTKQGFQNFKLNSEYEGAIPIVLALLAVFIAIVGGKGKGRGQGAEDKGQRTDGSRHKQKGEKLTTESHNSQRATCNAQLEPVLSQRRGDIIFWGIATLVALLLAFGRFFPLYSLFYQIPGMSSIRCPQKFLHVFQIGIGILAAFGADALLRGIPEGLAKWTRRFAVMVLVLGGLLLLWTASLASSREALTSGFVSEGWSRYASVMVNNMVQGAFHASMMTLAVGAGLLLLVVWRQRQQMRRNGVMAAIVLVMVGDVWLLSRDYIKTVSFQEVAGDNVVTTFLKDNLKQQRVYMLSQEGFYNNWLTVLFPYHQIETFNVSQMPRMPVDYDLWLKSVGRDPLRLWQLSAIGYMLAPEQTWQQIQKDPRFARHFEAVKGFNVYAVGTGVSVVEVPLDKPAGHRILRFKDGLPRFNLFHDWGIAPDEVVRDRLVDRIFDPLSKVWVASDTAGALPAAVMTTNINHEVLESTLSTTGAKVTANVASPAVLMFVNKHSDDWRVDVDGRPAPLLRCNSLCLGVYLEPGTHQVRFYLRQKWGLFLVEIGGLLVCLVAVLFLWLRQKPDNRSDQLQT
ncbi:MAG: hypothetical protein WCS52_08320 [bacterium]